METESQVLTAEVTYEGQTVTAPYYVEHDVIHANVAGRIVSTPLGDEPAEQTVKALMLEVLQRNGRAAEVP